MLQKEVDGNDFVDPIFGTTKTDPESDRLYLSDMESKITSGRETDTQYIDIYNEFHPDNQIDLPNQETEEQPQQTESENRVYGS